MKKKLNTEAIRNELEESSFFPGANSEPARQEQVASPPPTPLSSQTTEINQGADTTIPRHHDTKHGIMTPSDHDTMIPPTEDEIVEEVRKAVRQIGKEPATQRLTLEEKQALNDIEYSYKRQGIKTSGNEIIRIATNYIVRDYQQNGENSILAKVLKRLNS
jgi:hypothetical protein